MRSFFTSIDLAQLPNGRLKITQSMSYETSMDQSYKSASAPGTHLTASEKLRNTPDERVSTTQSDSLVLKTTSPEAISNTIELLTDTSAPAPPTATFSPAFQNSLSYSPTPTSNVATASKTDGIAHSSLENYVTHSFRSGPRPTQAAAEDNTQQQDGGGKGVVLGSILGGVFGMLACAIIVIVFLNCASKSRRKRKEQRELAKGGYPYESGSFNSGYGLYRPDDSILAADPPVDFNPSPFDSENLLRISRGPGSTMGSRMNIPTRPSSSFKQNEYYQYRARPEILPARPAPPSPAPPTPASLENLYGKRSESSVPNTAHFIVETPLFPHDDTQVRGQNYFNRSGLSPVLERPSPAQTSPVRSLQISRAPTNHTIRSNLTVGFVDNNSGPGSHLRPSPSILRSPRFNPVHPLSPPTSVLSPGQRRFTTTSSVYSSDFAQTPTETTTFNIGSPITESESPQHSPEEIRAPLPIPLVVQVPAVAELNATAENHSAVTTNYLPNVQLGDDQLGTFAKNWKFDSQPATPHRMSPSPKSHPRSMVDPEHRSTLQNGIQKPTITSQRSIIRTQNSSLKFLRASKASDITSPSPLDQLGPRGSDLLGRHAYLELTKKNSLQRKHLSSNNSLSLQTPLSPESWKLPTKVDTVEEDVYDDYLSFVMDYGPNNPGIPRSQAHQSGDSVAP